MQNLYAHFLNDHVIKLVHSLFTHADGTVLLYDPRKLTSPWDQTTCSGSHVIKDLHWQHTSSSKSSRTAAKASSQDSHAARSSAEQNGATTSAVSMQAHAASVFATPAPASNAAVSVLMLFACLPCSPCIYCGAVGQRGRG